MIDELSMDFRGWARFSDDRKMRYRLARSFTPFSPAVERQQGSPRVVFLMLNPSTADAFKVDPTVARCCEFARRWGADVLEVVNLFALRSTDPKALYLERSPWEGWRERVGGDAVNDGEIFDACRGAQRVIAAWGNHGELAGRGAEVAAMLAIAGVRLETLRATNHGYPSHPLARGKSFIPYDVQPVAYP